MEAVLALEALRWLCGWWLLWRVPRPDDAAVPARRVSVVVPARNEAASIGRLLESLRGAEAEIVVVDDSSEDDTAAIARAAGARVIQAPPLPDDWAGKPWACATGAAAATGDVLVFLDADTRLHPGGLSRLVATHARRGGLVTVQPFHRPERPYERLSLFPNIVGPMAIDAFSLLGPRLGARGAFGPCLVLDRATYERLGGHAAVRREVAEDVALARRCRALRIPITCLGGRGVVEYRMYPGGVRQLVEGWTKNLGVGAASVRLATVVLVVLWVSGVASAPLALVDDRPGLLLYGAYAAQLAVLAGRIGAFGPAAVALFPLPLLFFVVVFARSLVLTALGRDVSWRGRRVPSR